MQWNEALDWSPFQVLWIIFKSLKDLKGSPDKTPHSLLRELVLASGLKPKHLNFSLPRSTEPGTRAPKTWAEFLVPAQRDEARLWATPSPAPDTGLASLSGLCANRNLFLYCLFKASRQRLVTDGEGKVFTSFFMFWIIVSCFAQQNK